MNSADVIAYTADADCYCPRCTVHLYGTEQHPLVHHDNHGREHADGRRHDNEGNEVHPVFADSWGEWADTGLYCGHCREEIIPPYCQECGDELQDGPCPNCTAADDDEDDEDEPATIQGSNWLALEILAWHGGQSSATYRVGSTWHALREVPVSLAWEACRELRRVPGAEKVAAALEVFLEGSGYQEVRAA